MIKIKPVYLACRGFNLIETAIVLAVIGLTLGGIYVAASGVYENRRVGRSVEQIAQLVANMRTLYDGQQLDPSCANWCDCDITTLAIKGNYMPADMTRTNDTSQAFNQWGGNFQVCAAAWMNTQQFRGVFVNFNPIPRSACIKLLTQLLSRQTTDIAFFQVNATGFYMPPYGVTTVPTLTEASTYCSSSNANALQFVYKF